MEKIFINDTFSERKAAKIDIEDRGFQFGDGIYEVIRVYKGQLYKEEEHLNRLYQSALKVSITIPYAIKKVKKIIEQLVKMNNIDTGTVYLQISRGTSPRQHFFPAPNVEATFVAYTNVLARQESLMQKGGNAILSEDIRWLRCDIKTINLLPNILAKQEANEKDCIEAIQHRGDIITEGASTNIFIVKDGVVRTHAATNLILNGITRQTIIKLCKENNIQYKTEAFTVVELLAADEVFMAGTGAEIVPLLQVDRKEIGEGNPGNITRLLQQLLINDIEKKCGIKLSSHTNEQ